MSGIGSWQGKAPALPKPSSPSLELADASCCAPLKARRSLQTLRTRLKDLPGPLAPWPLGLALRYGARTLQN